MKNYKPEHSVFVAIFALVVAVICAIVGTRDDDTFLKGLAIGMFIMAAINLVVAWWAHRATTRGGVK